MPGGYVPTCGVVRGRAGSRRLARRPSRRSVLVDDVLELVARVADLVLDRAGGLVDLALALEAVISGEVSPGFLHAALEIVSAAVAHDVLPSLAVDMAYPTAD